MSAKSYSTTSLFPEKFLVSCVTKDKKPLLKIMSLDRVTGQVVKDGLEYSNIPMISGKAFRQGG